MNVKTKSLAAAAVLAVLAGAGWGRSAWRAHRGLVTLHVRNAPLAAVVKSIERQTWQTIEFDHALNAKITVNLVDAPLPAALDAVAARAGARWQIVDAVGSTQLAWRQLELALASGGDVAGAGWTNLAPQFDEAPRLLRGEGAPDENHPAPPPGASLRRVFRDVGPEGGERIITMGGDGKIDQWSAARLVMETRLAASFGTALPQEATSEAATQAATAAHGEARRYYALEKAPFGMSTDGGMRPMRRFTGGPNPPFGSPPRDIGATIAADQQQRRLLEMANSPEQQVAQARERAANGGQVRTLHFQNQ